MSGAISLGEERVTYHHVGSGVTSSVHFCRTCDGWYGVPHNTHDHQHLYRDGCACRPCQEKAGRYPNEGVMMTHSAYLVLRSSGDPSPGAE